MKLSATLKAVTLAAAAGSLALLFSAPASASPDVTGKSFSNAQTALKTAGYTVVVASTVGDKTAQSDCVVTGQRDQPTGISWLTSQTVNGVFVGGDQPTLYPITLRYIPSSGKVLLSLSCYRATKPTQ